MRPWAGSHGGARDGSLELGGRRVVLRPLVEADWPEWRAVRTRCHEWLVCWEPRVALSPYQSVEQVAFRARLGAFNRDRELGTSYGFGIFVEGRFAGEINLSGIQRGAFQSGNVGYWIDEALAGRSLVPEALVVMLDFAFRRLGLHRVEVAIVPRNAASLRVVEKVGMRREGVAERFLMIDGAWEDHIRFALTTEEWAERRGEVLAAWGVPQPV